MKRNSLLCNEKKRDFDIELCNTGQIQYNFKDEHKDTQSPQRIKNTDAMKYIYICIWNPVPGYFCPIVPVIKCMGYALTQSVQIHFSLLFGSNSAAVFALHIMSLIWFYVSFS